MMMTNIITTEQTIKLDDIIVDNTLNPREGALDQEAVLDYAAHIDDLPPMVAFRLPDGEHLLVAGFHRIAAHRLAGAFDARFVVHEGSRNEAHEFADLDNLKHGLRLTRREKRMVISRYLKRHSERSDVWVAKECYTTDKTVRSVREELEISSEIPTHDVLMDVNGIERPRSAPRPVGKELAPSPMGEEHRQSGSGVWDDIPCAGNCGRTLTPNDMRLGYDMCKECEAEFEQQAEATSQEEVGGDDTEVYDAESSEDTNQLMVERLQKNMAIVNDALENADEEIRKLSDKLDAANDWIREIEDHCQQAYDVLKDAQPMLPQSIAIEEAIGFLEAILQLDDPPPVSDDAKTVPEAMPAWLG